MHSKSYNSENIDKGWPEFGALALYGLCYAIGSVGILFGLHSR